MKNKISTIIIILVTLILAGVAIFTAVKLYNLRQSSVSPTAPESKPKAAENDLVSCNQTCNSTVNPPVNCVEGLICRTSSNLDGANGVCRNNNCLDNEACDCSPSDQCKISFNITATTTSSSAPTDSPTPTSSPTVTASPTASPTNTASGEPNACGGTCGSNNNCQGSYVCYQGYCRNASCVTKTNCSCDSATTASATQASLPDSGTSWPSIFGMGLGVIVILGAMMLAL